MTKFALDGAIAEAYGHPSICTEPKDGTVEATSTIRYNGTSIASETTATIEFDSHGHDVDDGTCVDNESHSIVPNVVSDTVRYNGGGLFLVADGVDTDPGTGDNIDIIDANGNGTVSEG